MIPSKHGFLKDIERIRSLSTIIDKKLSEVKPSDAEKIDKLTLEELQIKLLELQILCLQNMLIKRKCAQF